MDRHNHRQDNSDLANIIARAMTTALPNLIVQIQHHISHHPQHPNPPEYHVKGGNSTKSRKRKAKDTTKKAATVTSGKANKKKKRNQSKNAIPTIPLPQIPTKTKSDRRPYKGSHPYCRTCTIHHPLDMVCKFCTNCNRYGHSTTKCRTPKIPTKPSNEQQSQPKDPTSPDVFLFMAFNTNPRYNNLGHHTNKYHGWPNIN